MRKNGILMHLSSLPSSYGIGAMGQTAKDFVDFLQASGQSYWQLLPICPTSYGDSPYQSYSTFAGNPYFIDLDELHKMGLLEKEDYSNIDWENEPERVNFGALYRKRYPVLHKAVDMFLTSIPEDFQEFCERNSSWLSDFALFMALKDVHGGAPWSEWVPPLRNRESKALAVAEKAYEENVIFWKVLQYLFFKQWEELKSYANERGIKIIGDLPIYVSLDSVDVWAHPELFQLDDNKVPKEVAVLQMDFQQMVSFGEIHCLIGITWRKMISHGGRNVFITYAKFTIFCVSTILEGSTVIMPFLTVTIRQRMVIGSKGLE